MQPELTKMGNPREIIQNAGFGDPECAPDCLFAILLACILKWFWGRREITEIHIFAPCFDNFRNPFSPNSCVQLWKRCWVERRPHLLNHFGITLGVGREGGHDVKQSFEPHRRLPLNVTTPDVTTLKITTPKVRHTERYHTAGYQ